MLLSSDTAAFRENFESRLVTLLNRDEPGTFILVLANSMQNQQLHDALAAKLQASFNHILNNPDLHAPKDDLLIINTLKAQGISQYGVWKTRRIHAWQCTCNPFRALRPERSSKAPFAGLKQPFNDDAFHFSKAFLRAEILSTETFEETDLQIMYQKFPFAPYHLLIVIDAAQKKAQFLDEKTHKMIWNLALHIETNISGFGLSYNSLGAGASVNQLHIHGFINQDSFAIEQNSWAHNGGRENYPLAVERFHSARAAWEKINQFHTLKQAYNLLYRAGVCYLIPRKPQGSVTSAKWLGNMSWYEACGNFNLSEEDYFTRLNSNDIYSALKEYSV